MKAWSVVGLLFAAAILATVPVSPQVTPRGSLQLTIDKAEAYTRAGPARDPAGVPARLSQYPAGLSSWLLQLR